MGTRLCRIIGITAIALLLSCTIVNAETVKLRLLSADAGKRMSAVRPQEMRLSETRPLGAKKLPLGLTAPLYGIISLGPKGSQTTFIVLVNAPQGSPSNLYVDTNGNGDLTDGPKPGLVRALGASYHTDSLPDSGVRGDVLVECTGVSSVVLDALTCGAVDAITCIRARVIGRDQFMDLAVTEAPRFVVRQRHAAVIAFVV